MDKGSGQVDRISAFKLAAQVVVNADTDENGWQYAFAWISETAVAFSWSSPNRCKNLTAYFEETRVMPGQGAGVWDSMFHGRGARSMFYPFRHDELEVQQWLLDDLSSYVMWCMSSET